MNIDSFAVTLTLMNLPFYIHHTVHTRSGFFRKLNSDSDSEKCSWTPDPYPSL